MRNVNTRVYSRIGEVSPAPSVVTIGAFDGVHRGHQHLLAQARFRADEIGARLLVVTFEPLPIQVFRPDSFPGRIVTNLRRRELLFANGADVLVELPFSREMAKVTAEAFVDELIAAGPLRELLVGEDFALGHNREGTPERLAELTREHGTVVRTLCRIDVAGDEVSSSAIRRCIIEGRAEDASRLLGHRFQVRGEVVRGAQIGRTIGFPTANVAPPQDLVPLQDGIYASLAQVDEDDALRPAMTYIGTRPAVNTGARMIETHLFDFSGDLYGRQLTTSFVRHIRQDADFPSVDALRDQLDRDEIVAREVLAVVSSNV
ncbi:MAG TPA: riboflavin biosynthesis protein RibF [Thermomicrobiales bacterium]|nr:riboflavin biosynthesis protein RibF [Thermomicrobiales bacterium]